MPKPRERKAPEAPEDLAELQRRLDELEANKRALERRNRELVLENTLLRRELKMSPGSQSPLPRALMSHLLGVLKEWAGCFQQRRVYERARDLALGFLLNPGRNTLTQVLCTLGRSQEDWTADYRMFSERDYDPAALFVPVIHRSLEQDRRSAAFVAVALDDSSVRKTGKKNGSVRLIRSPLSPAFRANLEPRQRFLEAAVLVRPEGGKGPCRAIPAGFRDAPSAAKPSRKDSEASWAEYRVAQRAQRLGVQAAELAARVSGQIAQEGTSGKPVLWCVDGSLTNGTFVTSLEAGAQFIGRARKDSALYEAANRSEPGRRDSATGRVYGERLPTPEAYRKDPQVPWQTCRVFAAQKGHWPRFKEIGPVLWRRGTKSRPLRLLVIEPLAYRPSRSRKVQYRWPAYLLTSDMTSPAGDLVQAYMDRWEIEPMFRDQKTTLGLGEAQVWSSASVERVPSFVAAVHGVLLVGSLAAFGPRRTGAYGVRAKWRNDKRLRPSLTDLRTRMRREAWGLGDPPSCAWYPLTRSWFEGAVPSARGV